MLSAAAGVAGEDLAVAAAVRVGLRQAGASGSYALVRTGGGALVRVGSGQLGTAMLGLAGGSAARLALPATTSRLALPMPYGASIVWAGNNGEMAARQLALAAGETIINSQWRHGVAMRGFDFLSFTGRGASAQLYINEVKNKLGAVGSTSFTTLVWAGVAMGCLRKR